MEFLAYPTIVKAECEKEKIYKVLINALDVIGTDAPTVDRFLIGEKIANVIGPKIKLAAVWPEKDIDKLAETVALNRGGDFYVVSNVEAAKDWLLNDKKEISYTTFKIIEITYKLTSDI